MDGARPGDHERHTGDNYVDPPPLQDRPQFDPTILSGPAVPTHDGELVPVENAEVLHVDAGTMMPSRDLPVYEEVVPQEDVRRTVAARPAPAPAPVQRPAHYPANLPAPTDSVTLTAIMGSVTREGSWVPARHTTINVLMGEAKLDFTTATAIPDEVTVRVQVLMGDCTLKVPANAEVVMQGTPIMADLKEVTKHRRRRKLRRLLGEQAADELVRASTSGFPMRLVVTGVVVMGDVKVERVLDS